MAWDDWEKGYTLGELERAQERFGLIFPPDLLALLLERRLRKGPDWNDEAIIRERLAWPFEGLLFDVENSVLWWREWGERPESSEERAEVLRGIVSRAPKMIPLYAHRYLPETPNQAGNPVFSVYQSDVIYYGSDLENYLTREFENRDAPLGEIRRILFWSDLAEGWGEPPASDHTSP